MLSVTEKFKQVGIPINLQLFADNVVTDEDDKLDETDLGTNVEGWKPAASKDEESERLAKVSMKQKAKTERSKLRILGVDSFDTGKKLIDEHPALTKQIAELTKLNAELTGKLYETELDTKLIGVGVDPAKIGKAKVLLTGFNQEKTDDKIKALLEDEDYASILMVKHDGIVTKPKMSLLPKQGSRSESKDDPRQAADEFNKTYNLRD